MSSERATLLLKHSERLHAAMERFGTTAHNETELRLGVEPVIRDALRELYALDLDRIRSERTNAAGRLDTAYGGVVVEYEFKMGRARRRHGAEQAISYLTAERQRLGEEKMFSACVTDGIEWGFLLSDEAFTEQRSMFSALPADDVDRFVWYENTVAACQRFLELVGSHPKTPVSGESLSDVFGSGSPDARRCLTLLLEALTAREAHDRADTLYGEWRRALEVAYGTLDNDDQGRYGINEAYDLTIAASLGETLFTLHTFFALVARLVALEILAISVGDQSSRPSTWSALDDSALMRVLRRFERGELPLDLHVANVLHGDVFSWYVERAETNVSLLNAVRSLCTKIDGFAFPRLAFGAGHALDLFRDLYQRLTTRELRGALGEFLTPRWLAEATIEAAMEHGANIETGRILDPTCGTGTFLSPLVARRLRNLRKKGSVPSPSELQEVLDTVVGIDINPVAVVAARMNVLISLGDLAEVGELQIPIWLADSILLPEPPANQVTFTDRYPELIEASYVELATSLEQPFVLPVECLEQPRLARVAAVIRCALDERQSGAAFAAHLETELGPDATEPLATGDQWQNALRVLGVLYGQLLQLVTDGRNGVWTEIIENRFAPLFLEPFDVVLGNPPWLTFTKLPEAWRRKATPIWRNYGLYEAPRISGGDEPASLHTSDLAVLVTGVALDRYLVDGGVLAFVVPKALINGDPGNRAFRKYRLSSGNHPSATRAVDVEFKMLSIDDYSDVHPFSPDASNSPIVFVIRRGSSTTFPVPGRRWQRQVAGATLPSAGWEKVKRGFLKADSVRWEPISTFPPSPLAWWFDSETSFRGEPSRYKYGKGFDTRGANGILFLTLRGRAQGSGTIRVSNDPELGRSAELRRAGPHVANVEAALVVPAIRGRDVSAYKVSPSAWLLLPHSTSARSKPLSESELRAFPGARQFLNNFRPALRARRPYMNFVPTDSLWWQVQGVDHMDSGYFVCISEIASGLAAAVAAPFFSEELGRTVLPIVDHKCTFLNTEDEAEAYYLAGMLNSEAITTLADRFANFIAISPATLRNLPITKFDLANSLHVAISKASRAAHAGVESGPAEVNVVVAKLMAANRSRT